MDPNVNKGLQIACMACGIASIPGSCGYGVVGLALGIAALVMANKISAQTGGELAGMSKAGKICGMVGMILSILAIVGFILMFALGLASGMSSY